MNDQIKLLIKRCIDSHLRLNGLTVQQECVILTNFLAGSGEKLQEPTEEEGGEDDGNKSE